MELFKDIPTAEELKARLAKEAEEEKQRKEESERKRRVQIKFDFIDSIQEAFKNITHKNDYKYIKHKDFRQDNWYEDELEFLDLSDVREELQSKGYEIKALTVGSGLRKWMALCWK